MGQFVDHQEIVGVYGLYLRNFRQRGAEVECVFVSEAGGPLSSGLPGRL